MGNEQQIWNYLYKHFKNPYGTAAMMGNLFAESSLNPMLANNVKKIGLTSAEYTKRVDNGNITNFATDGIAYGLAQWYYNTRKQGLYDKARSNNKSIGDLQTQLEYLIDELKEYKTVYETLFNATSVKEASDIILVKYEKPANQSNSVKEKRASYGNKYYTQFYCSNDVKINKRAANELFAKLKNSI